MRRLVIALFVAAAAVALGAQRRYVDGVFIHANGEPIELLTYADRIASGQLRLSAGSFEDVPVVPAVHRILCSLPNWRPVTVWATTRAIFRDELAERRQLPFGIRKLNVYAVEMRVAAVEEPAGVLRLLEGLGATEEDPGLLLITLESGGVTRDYVVALGQGR
jgi:hypothetical protein